MMQYVYVRTWLLGLYIIAITYPICQEQLAERSGFSHAKQIIVGLYVFRNEHGMAKELIDSGSVEDTTSV